MEIIITFCCCFRLENVVPVQSNLICCSGIDARNCNIPHSLLSMHPAPSIQKKFYITTGCVQSDASSSLLFAGPMSPHMSNREVIEMCQTKTSSEVF